MDNCSQDTLFGSHSSTTISSVPRRFPPTNQPREKVKKGLKSIGLNITISVAPRQHSKMDTSAAPGQQDFFFLSPILSTVHFLMLGMRFNVIFMPFSLLSLLYGVVLYQGFLSSNFELATARIAIFLLSRAAGRKRKEALWRPPEYSSGAQLLPLDTLELEE